MKKEWPVTLDAYREAISEEWEVDRVSTLKDQATGGRSNRPKFVIMMRSNEVKSLQGPVKTSLHSNFIYSVDIYPTWARPWA